MKIRLFLPLIISICVNISSELAFNACYAQEPPVNLHKNLSYSAVHLDVLPLLQMNQERPSIESLIFIHIPKSGGTNIVHFAEAARKTSLRFAVPRLPGRSPNLITKDWIGGLQSADEKLLQEPNYCQEKNFISGHFPFGLHTRLFRAVKYISLVRQPIDREISSLNFDYQRDYVTRSNAGTYLLDTMIDNPQTRMLAGEKFMLGPCHETTLEQAKKNIEEHFLLVGITEETNTFIQVLASIRGWGPAALAKAQITKQKVYEATPENIEQLLRKKHSYDLELYEWVKERWNRWKKENIANTIPIKSGQKILTLMSDYSQSKCPQRLTLSEIEKHNSQVKPSTLVELNQRHAGIDDKS